MPHLTAGVPGDVFAVPLLCAAFWASVGGPVGCEGGGRAAPSLPLGPQFWQSKHLH